MPFAMDELILAAHVRMLANSLRINAFAAAEEAADMGYKTLEMLGYKPLTDESVSTLAHFESIKLATDKARANFEATWMAQNPIHSFVPQAVRELQAVAAIVRATKA